VERPEVVEALLAGTDLRAAILDVVRHGRARMGLVLSREGVGAESTRGR
jgi:hypothetical protein